MSSSNYLRAAPFTETGKQLGKCLFGSYVGCAQVGFRDNSPTVLGGLRRRSSEKTFTVGPVWVAIKAAGRETRVAGGPGVVCIRLLLVLLREPDVIRRAMGWECRSSGHY